MFYVVVLIIYRLREFRSCPFAVDRGDGLGGGNRRQAAVAADQVDDLAGCRALGDRRGHPSGPRLPRSAYAHPWTPERRQRQAATWACRKRAGVNPYPQEDVDDDD